VTDGLYERLAAALDALPNGFPRTASGVELRLLQRIFSAAEAKLALALGSSMEPVRAIAPRLGLGETEARKALMPLVRRGMAWFERRDGEACFRLAPFVVGIYEAQSDDMDAELARLVEDYMAQGGAAGIMRARPALMRVIPVREAVVSDQILPYEDVRALLLAARSFEVDDCVCRLQQGQLGRRCEHQVHNCLVFSQSEGGSGPGQISREQALAILDEAEKAGLVHSVSNMREGLGFVCNCCGCCCAGLRGINEWGIAQSVASANYVAAIDAEACVGCGVCVGRCQVHAIAERGSASAVVAERCIGCGLCVSGCVHGAARLEPRPDADIDHPPLNYAAWEEARRRHRRPPEAGPAAP
jgi:Na+-translocating ferredoxin:NAD+ oxidoreductase subunit B